MKKTRSSILDLPSPNLYEGLWDESNMLRSDREKFLLELVRNELALYDPDLDILAVLIYGSLASYNYFVSDYMDCSDLDIAIYLNFDSKDINVSEIQDYFKGKVYKFSDENIEIHLFIKSPEENGLNVETSNGVYDLLKGKWVIEPVLYLNDPFIELESYIEEAERVASNLDSKLSRLIRVENIINRTLVNVSEEITEEETDNRIEEYCLETYDLVEELVTELEDLKSQRNTEHKKLREKLEKGIPIKQEDRISQTEVTLKYLDMTCVLTNVYDHIERYIVELDYIGYRNIEE